eukprot:scaffold141422_cov190-Phaeocystis_antarctica.AAC.1
MYPLITCSAGSSVTAPPLGAVTRVTAADQLVLHCAVGLHERTANCVVLPYNTVEAASCTESAGPYATQINVSPAEGLPPTARLFSITPDSASATPDQRS